MRDYRKLAEALAPGIPPAQLDRVIAPLEILEIAFRPVAGSVPLETEPAIAFSAPPEEAQ